MALQKFYIGTHGPYYYDDTDDIDDPDGDFSGDTRDAVTTSGQIKLDTAPTLDEHIVRKKEIEDFVTGPATSIDDNLASFDGVTGKKIKDSGVSSITVANAVTGPASSIDTHIVMFDGTTGKKIADSGITAAGVSDAVARVHDKYHAMTTVNVHTATPWHIFASDGSGNIIEIGFGTAGQVLTSNGASALPSFQ